MAYVTEKSLGVSVLKCYFTNNGHVRNKIITMYIIASEKFYHLLRVCSSMLAQYFSCTCIKRLVSSTEMQLLMYCMFVRVIIAMLCSSEARFVYLKKSTASEKLGISLVGGNAVGVFIQKVDQGSVASTRDGLLMADQILEVRWRDHTD